jgi:hypothetical protein
VSLRLYMDVQVPQGITDALRARNVRVTTAQEDNHAEADDSALLARATALGCVCSSPEIRISCRFQPPGSGRQNRSQV